MSIRLWYPQLDVYDTARRMGVLLQFFRSPPGIERLYISDFYLATPSLLHTVSMSRETRKLFSELKILKPEKCFVSLPAPQILFHKMEPIQKQALVALSGRNLISNSGIKEGLVRLTESGEAQFRVELMALPEEIKLCDFLATHFFPTVEAGNKQLRVETGLRRSI